MLTTLAVLFLGVLAPPARVPAQGQVQASASVAWTEFAPPNGRFISGSESGICENERLLD